MAANSNIVFDEKTKARFWASVDMSVGHGPEGTCWLWTGRQTTMKNRPDWRYGNFWAARKNWRAHRVSLMLAGIMIPKRLVVDHGCRNPLCVNPDHLEIVTNGVNIKRGISPTALKAAQTHCIRGHPLGGANLYIRKCDGSRICLTCDKAMRARRSDKRKIEVARSNAKRKLKRLSL